MFLHVVDEVGVVDAVVGVVEADDVALGDIVETEGHGASEEVEADNEGDVTLGVDYLQDACFFASESGGVEDDFFVLADVVDGWPEFEAQFVVGAGFDELIHHPLGNGDTVALFVVIEEQSAVEPVVPILAEEGSEVAFFASDENVAFEGGSDFVVGSDALAVFGIVEVVFFFCAFGASLCGPIGVFVADAAFEELVGDEVLEAVGVVVDAPLVFFFQPFFGFFGVEGGHDEPLEVIVEGGRGRGVGHNSLPPDSLSRVWIITLLSVGYGCQNVCRFLPESRNGVVVYLSSGGHLNLSFAAQNER